MMIKTFLLCLIALTYSCKQSDTSSDTQNILTTNLEIGNSHFSIADIENLDQIDKDFYDLVVRSNSDSILRFQTFLENMIIELNENGYYSCKVKSIVDFSKADFFGKLDSTLYNKIFKQDITNHISRNDTLSINMSTINTKGIWIDNLKMHSSHDEFITTYLKHIYNPMFLDSLGYYRDNMDFNNQTHRLILLFHLMSQSSIWIYNQC